MMSDESAGFIAPSGRSSTFVASCRSKVPLLAGSLVHPPAFLPVTSHPWAHGLKPGASLFTALGRGPGGQTGSPDAAVGL